MYVEALTPAIPAGQNLKTPLVFVHGGRLSEDQAGSVGAWHSAAFLPYRAVLSHAALCITHGGSNTVLDALACGVPLLVRPAGFDQPGNLARVRHHGLGERLESMRRPARLAEQVRRVIGDSGMKGRCENIAKALAQAGGAARAAEVVEGELR